MKKTLWIIALLLTALLLSGCKTLFFIPGASIGYFLTRAADGSIVMEYSTDRKDTSFSGTVTTDGAFTEVTSRRFDDEAVLTIEKDTFSFQSRLNESEFADVIVIRAEGHTYMEFDLRINDAHDLARISITEFLNNPTSQTFRLDDSVFEAAARRPWYEKNPFANLFAKLAQNTVFTAIFLIVLGVLIVEVLRVTRFRTHPRKKAYLAISYGLVTAGVALAFLFLGLVT